MRNTHNRTLQSLRIGLLAAAIAVAHPARAATFTLNFNSAVGGTILDSNGVGTGMISRMVGSGSNIFGNDTNLLLNTGASVLGMHTSPGADFNGQVAMTNATVVGINLSDLGFTGGNDFTATAQFINITNLLLQPDQLCLVVGTATGNSMRAGFINFSAFHATNTDANEGFGVDTLSGSDLAPRFFGTVVGSSMTVVISRVGGVWSATVNGIDRLPNSSADGTGTPAPPTFLDSETNLFVGVVAMDVGNDSPWSANLKTFSVNVSGNSPPSVATQPQKQLVNEGNPASFSVVASDSTKAPVTYQWFRNGSPVGGATSATLNLFGVDSTVAGNYTVVLANSLGSATSSVAPLSVVLPSGTFALSFPSVTGGLKDMNGTGVGFPTRLPGTGAALLANDTNLFLNVANSTLDITTTSSDYNGGNGMDVNENLGVSLATLGFTGSEDLNVTALFPQPFPLTTNFDQFGIIIGIDTNSTTRAGSITFANKERYSENTQSTGGAPFNIGGQYFGFAFDSTIPMSVLITRTAGVWHHYIDTVNWDVFTQPTWVNAGTNLTAGVFAEDVANGIHKTVSVSSFKARVFKGIKLNASVGGGNVSFNWNVAGPSGLQSNTNLNNPGGWTAIPGATNSPFSMPFSASGNKFFRVVQ